LSLTRRRGTYVAGEINGKEFEELESKHRATSHDMHSAAIFRFFGRGHVDGRVHFVKRRAERWNRSIC
jgi:hypothetical protein